MQSKTYYALCLVQESLMTALSRSRALEGPVGIIQLFHTSFEAPRLSLSIHIAIGGPLPHSVNSFGEKPVKPRQEWDL
jgi:hypothetical protein